VVTENSFQDAPTRDSEPLLFHLAKLLERKNIRGSTRLLKSLARLGWLARPVDYRIGDSLRILVPIARNGYDRYDLDHYETEFLDALSTAIKQIPASFTLIDCGADIGVISIKLLAICPSITRTVAFEPNSEAYPWLQRNLERLKIPARAIHAAVADFEGKGRLIAPDAKWTPGIETNHTQYFLEPAPDGPIDVTKIDSLGCPASESLAIKLDLEGGELAALRGASQTISMAPNVVVAMEAHPAVAARTGIDPVECLRFLASLRPFLFNVSETGQTLDPVRAVFEQIAPTQVYNILARTNGAATLP
jgi:FkbM family methyltransferase